MEKRTIGILGGGQLGRMMAEAGHRLGLKSVILDPCGSSSSAGRVAQLSIEGSFDSKGINSTQKIKDLASVSDIVTVEIEHVDVDSLDKLVKMGIQVSPDPQAIRIIQDKYNQKNHIKNTTFDNVPMSDFMIVDNINDAYNAGNIYGYPYMLKRRRDAYDGRGNVMIKSINDIESAVLKLGDLSKKDDQYLSNGLYAERWVSFTKEIAVMVVKSELGIITYPAVETIQKDSICHIVVAPALITDSLQVKCREIACKAVESLPGNTNYGVFGVELFLLEDGSVIYNEMAPRPHNSGHYTMEATHICQFEAHLRAILGLPIPSESLEMKVNYAFMLNILGTGNNEETHKIFKNALNVPGVGAHWYSKDECKKGRKMGHITATGKNLSELRNRLSLCNGEFNDIFLHSK